MRDQLTGSDNKIAAFILQNPTEVRSLPFKKWPMQWAYQPQPFPGLLSALVWIIRVFTQFG